jgi:hypothetical protein
MKSGMGLIGRKPGKMEKLMAMMNTDEGKKAMAEDGLKVETIRILTEFSI